MADLFQPKFVDLVRNYTTTAGTDDFVLGPAANGYASLTAALQTGDHFYYAVLGIDNPADTEVGRGVLLAGGAISRDPIGGTKTDFKTGTKSISLIAAAEWFGQAQSLVGNLSPVGQALVNAPTAADARAELALGNIAVNPAWYGLAGGDDPALGQANSAAFAAMLDDVASSRRMRIVMPEGIYWFAGTIDLAIGNLLIEGASAGGADKIGDALTPVLRFPAGVTGIRVQDNQSSGANARDTVAHAAGGVVLRNLCLQGSFTMTEAEAHGVHLRRTATLENLSIANFEGDGIHIAADGGGVDGANPPYGNADMSFISRCTVKNCRNGLFLDGSDANACTIVHLNANVNRQWGAWDSSFLGNTFTGGQFTANGATSWNDGVTGPATAVSDGGHHYGAVVGQEPWCSTNPPSGDLTDNQGWYYLRDGGPIAGVPDWFGGILVRAGGCVHDDSDVGRSHYSGVYAEGDQGKAQIAPPSFVSGGVLATYIFRNAAFPGVGEVATIGHGGYGPTNIGYATGVEGALQARSGNVYAALGYPQGNSLNIINNMMHSTLCAAGYQFQFISPRTGSDAVIRFTEAAGAADVFWITTANTLENFGTGGALPNIFFPMQLAIGDGTNNTNNARRVTIDVAPPPSGAHAQGEFCLFSGGTGGLIGWKCIAAGTPGTWEGIYGGYGTGPVGYAGGAGGAVTQTVSKSSAVTLDALCGQVTMNAVELAAGTGVAFTVNNSEVAATDTIHLVLASGRATPGTYDYQVDEVGAGSFALWVKNISADPLGEALVFNFAIVKAVAA